MKTGQRTVSGTELLYPVCLSALDKMESLKPRIVVVGHKNMNNDDDGTQVIGQPGNTSLIFRNSPEKPRQQKSSAIKCWLDIRDGSIEAPFGVPRLR